MLYARKIQIYEERKDVEQNQLMKFERFSDVV